MTTSTFALADVAWLEGLASYFDDDYYDLRMKTSAFARIDATRLEEPAFHFGSDYFDPRHRLFRLRSPRYELRPRGAGDKAD